MTAPSGLSPPCCLNPKKCPSSKSPRWQGQACCSENICPCTGGTRLETTALPDKKHPGLDAVPILMWNRPKLCHTRVQEPRCWGIYYQYWHSQAQGLD